MCAIEKSNWERRRGDRKRYRLDIEGKGDGKVPPLGKGKNEAEKASQAKEGKGCRGKTNIKKTSLGSRNKKQ